VLLSLGMIAAIVGAKSYVIFHFGSDVPYSDQWGKEGGLIIAPYYEGKLKFGDFFVPHNEHRIAPTLALDLFWVACSGQWDARVECVANAFLAAAIAVGLAAFAWRTCGPGWGMALAWAGVGVGILPLVWENTLGGFQSQFYFLIGFSLVALRGLLEPRGARSAWWWLGLLCAGLAGVSMGSGFFCLLPVAGLMLARTWVRSRFSWGDLVTLVFAVALAAVNWAWRGQAPWHESIHAHSLGQFLMMALRCLAWPCPQWPALALLIWLPWIAFVISTWRRRHWVGDLGAEFIAGAGLWLLLQIAALAYSRGQAMGGMPSNRYGDISALSYPLNLLAGAVLVERAGRRRTGQGLVAGWAAVLAVCAVGAALPQWRKMLPALRAQSQLCDNNLRAYVITGNPVSLKAGQIPYPDPAFFREIIDRPALRAILPCTVRPPLALTEDGGASHGFVAAGASPATPPLPEAGWYGSYGASRPAVWRSQPVTGGRFAFWSWPMAGETGAGSGELRLRDPAGQPLSRAIVPTRSPGDSWRSAFAPVPRSGAFVVEATAGRPGAWMAFGPPAEESGLSEAVRRFCRQSTWIFVAGCAAIVLATLSWRRRICADAMPPRSD